MYYLQSRYYDPNTGRFINADTQLVVGDSIIGLNLFSYCENNPVNRIDFNGAEWFHWVIAAAVVVVAAAAVVVTAGGAAAAVAAVTCVANGIAATSTAATVAASAFIGSATALGVSALVASSESDTLDDFADYGATALASTAAGLLFGGLNGYSLSRSQNSSTQQIQKTDDGGACFIAGTLVHTQYALRPIEDIQQGDLVWAWDESSGDISLKRVVETYVNETNELIHIFVNGEEIITTPTHPFYSPIKGWTNATKLRAGDILVLLNGEYVIVEKIQHEILESPITVYNFHVEDYHTYFVTDVGILVHNMCAQKRDIKQIDQAARQLGMDQETRRKFGDYVEELKYGLPNNLNFTFKELLEIGKEVLGWTSNV